MGMTVRDEISHIPFIAVCFQHLNGYITGKNFCPSGSKFLPVREPFKINEMNVMK